MASFRCMRPLSPVNAVRCLGCGTLYSKPEGGGTAQSNPGCPTCGYVGWLPADSEFSGAAEPIRYVLDRPLRRSSQPG